MSSTLLSLFGMWQASKLLEDSTPGPWGIQRWQWGLLGMVLIALPASVLTKAIGLARELVATVLARGK